MEQNEKIRITIDTTKLPASATFTGKDGHKRISVDVALRRGGVDDYGNTHNVSVWDKETSQRIYVGSGKIETFGEAQQPRVKSSDDDLPL